MEWLVGLVTLTLLEIVLGIDNIVFISILAGRLPVEQQDRARKTGLLFALIPRILLLAAIGIVLKLTKPLFTIPFWMMEGKPLGITGQDLVLIIGGLFLIKKSVSEIHHKLEGQEETIHAKAPPTFNAVIVQIMLLNIVFSLDSVITAIGMVKEMWVMVVAVVLSTFFMLWFAGPVGKYVERHPTLKVLALSFLILIGGNLLVEGFHAHIPKGYTYFAMGFALCVEALNLRLHKNSKDPVHLRQNLPQ